jgi:ribonuclease T1
MLMLLVFMLTSCTPDLLDDIQDFIDSGEQGLIEENQQNIEESGRYTSKEEVALYIHTYGKLPSNFITKKEAQERGWDANKGNLWDVTDKMSIGGDVFSNREGILPKKEGRKYYECDINYEGGYRGAERIVFSNDGLIFYTDDHYKTFEQLY